jgi:DNA polymerase (family 10)
MILEMNGIRFKVCGSLRRLKSKTKSGVIVTDASVHEVHSMFREYDPTTRKEQPNTTLILVEDRFPVYFFSTTDEAWGSALLFYTGPIQYKKCLSSDARLQGYKLNRSGLWTLAGERIAGRTEAQVVECLGLPWVDPEKRKSYWTDERKALHEKRNRRGTASGLAGHRSRKK